jgi:hypothetical protein
MSLLEYCHWIWKMLYYVKEGDYIIASIRPVGSRQRLARNLEPQGVSSVMQTCGRDLDSLCLPTTLDHLLQEKAVTATQVQQPSRHGDCFFYELGCLAKYLHHETAPTLHTLGVVSQIVLIMVVQVPA